MCSCSSSTVFFLLLLIITQPALHGLTMIFFFFQGRETIQKKTKKTKKGKGNYEFFLIFFKNLCKVIQGDLRSIMSTAV